jgi:hypothetical protein
MDLIFIKKVYFLKNLFNSIKVFIFKFGFEKFIKSILLLKIKIPYLHLNLFQPKFFLIYFNILSECIFNNKYFIQKRENLYTKNKFLI